MRRLPPRLDHLPRGRRELVLAADDAFGEELTADAQTVMYCATSC